MMSVVTVVNRWGFGVTARSSEMKDEGGSVWHRNWFRIIRMGSQGGDREDRRGKGGVRTGKKKRELWCRREIFYFGYFVLLGR